MLKISSRRLVFLHGDLPQIEKAAMELVNAKVRVKPDNLVIRVPWIASDLPAGIVGFAESESHIEHVHISQAIQLLGCTQRLLVYISAQKFDANLLAAAAGTLEEYGCMIVGVADLDQSSHYLRYFFRVLEHRQGQYPALFSVKNCAKQEKSTDWQAISDLHEPLTTFASKNPAVPTHEQASFLDRTFEQLQIARRTRKQCCIMLRGRRGRGKTQALAWLVKRCLVTENVRRVFICAPSRKQAEPFLYIMGEQKGLQKRILYHSLDHFLDIIDRDDQKISKECDLLVIDEAAAVSLSLLKKIAHQGLNLVLATTTEGYEGSGRGFLLRYTEFLQRHYGNYFSYFLEQPIRWTDQDRLEPFIDTVCGLQWLHDKPEESIEVAQSAAFERAQLEKVLKIRKIEFSDMLLSDHDREIIYALLVSSHYQTRPSDLQRLFDASDQHLWIAEFEGSTKFHPVGALLAIEEGGFADQGDNLLAEQVAMGVRRPKGNLVAQKLASFFCSPEWCVQHSLRVSRIVVDKKFQRQGVATKLLLAMERFAASTPHGVSFDLWSSSFGFNEEISRFWLAVGASLLHLGHKYDKSSGERSAIVVKKLTDQESSYEQERMNFFKQVTAVDLKASQPEYQQHAESDIVDDARLNELDQARLARFVDGAIDWESTYPSLLRFLAQTPRSDFRYQNKDISVASLQTALVQCWPNAKASADYLGLTGRPQLLDLIRLILRSTL